MAGTGSGVTSHLNPTLLKTLILLLALGLFSYILGPPLYWHLAASSGCPDCNCDCSSQPLLSLPQELSNGSITDCAKSDPEVSEEMDKNFTDLLSEELKLHEEESNEAHKKADVALLEAKKLVSQFQKEADKCSSGMNTCEETREKAEQALSNQKKLSLLWELRAKQRGWKSGNSRSENR